MGEDQSSSPEGLIVGMSDDDRRSVDSLRGYTNPGCLLLEIGLTR
jgi:hypothetical protein